MKQLPTAEELTLKSLTKGEVEFLGQSSIDDIVYAMKEFAKLHVKAALESALEDAPYGSSTDTVSYKDMKDAILNAYPLENIK